MGKPVIVMVNSPAGGVKKEMARVTEATTIKVEVFKDVTQLGQLASGMMLK